MRLAHLALLLLLAAAAQQAAAPDSLDSICKGIDNAYQCAQAIERHQLRQPKLARVAERAGAELRLRLQTGRTLTLRDSADKNDPSVTLFSFRDYLEPIGYFLINRQLYEGMNYALIHARTAKHFELQALPVMSPDRVRFITTSAGLSGGYSPNAVQIWRVQPDGLELEFELRPDNWEPDEPKWLDNRTIQLRKQAPLLGDARAFSKIVQLKLGEKWTLEETVPRERHW